MSGTFSLTTLSHFSLTKIKSSCAPRPNQVESGLLLITNCNCSEGKVKPSVKLVLSYQVVSNLFDCKVSLFKDNHSSFFSPPICSSEELHQSVLHSNRAIHISQESIVGKWTFCHWIVFTQSENTSWKQCHLQICCPLLTSCHLLVSLSNENI